MRIEEIVEGKSVIFITTKNVDYIRNVQEIKILMQHAKSYEVIHSERKNYILRILSVWKKTTEEIVDRNDVVFIGFAPQLIIPFIGYKFKKKTIVIDFFISIYDTLICDRRWFKKKGIVAKILHKLDEYTLKKCNHVITDTKAHAEFFISEFYGKREKFQTIYLEADSNTYYVREQNKPRKLKDKFVVLYFGSILPLQGVDIVLDAISEFKNKDNIYFDIIGPISSRYHKPEQENVCYTEWLSQEELAEHIANADLCLAGHFSGIINKADRTIPGKAYIYESMSKKMILGDSVANRELFTEDENHYFVKRGDSKAVVKMINAIIGSI